MTIENKLHALRNTLTTTTRPNGDKVICFTDGVITNNTPEYRVLSDLIHDEHGTDSAYNVTVQLLDALIDSGIESSDDLDDAIDGAIDSVIPVYTSELTGWLAEHPAYVDYMTQAMGEFCPEDGTAILTGAYSIFIRGFADVIRSYLENDAE